MLKFESRTSLHAGFVPKFCSYYFKNGCLRHFVIMFCGTANLALFLPCCSEIFCQNQGFCFYKIVLKKECTAGIKKKRNVLF